MSMGTPEHIATVRLGRQDFSIPDAEAFCRRFANGFFWIAGLSLINMITMATGSRVVFFLGLGVTQDFQLAALTMDDDVFTLIAYLVGGGATALFIFLGLRARQIKRWPFILGMSLYALDSLIFLVDQEYISFGFHMFWLLFLSVGLKAVSPILAARQRASQPAQPDTTAELPAFLRGRSQA